jgi:diaminopimelate dehydrogenase
MRVRRLAVIGFGKLGRACCETVSTTEDLTLAGIVRRRDHLGEALPAALRGTPVVAHPSELPPVDGALICVDVAHVIDAARVAMEHGIAVVECAQLHGAALAEHSETIGRVARHHNLPAIVGAGWDPGAASMLRTLFAIVAPRGHTEMTHRPSEHMRHLVPRVPGIADGLYVERRAPDGRMQRYVYVQLERGADFDTVATTIRADPLFLGEDTSVFPIDDAAELEHDMHGVVIERRGSAAHFRHEHLLAEARFDVALAAARVMVGAARALSALHPGAYTILDLRLAVMSDLTRQQSIDDFL